MTKSKLSIKLCCLSLEINVYPLRRTAKLVSAACSVSVLFTWYMNRRRSLEPDCGRVSSLGQAWLVSPLSSKIHA